MLFGFWSWVLVIAIVALIFAANRLPDLQKQAKEKIKSGAEAVRKGQKELQEKINQKVQEKKKAAEEKKKAQKEEDDAE